MMFAGGNSLSHLFGVNLIEQEFCEMCVLKGGEKGNHLVECRTTLTEENIAVKMRTGL